MKCRLVRRIVAVSCAVFLVAVQVLVPCRASYAAVSITEAGAYFFRMLCSAAGLYFERSEVGLVVDVLNQVAAQSNVINSQEFKDRMDYMLSLSPSDRIDETFSNAFLADLINVFNQSTIHENGHGGGGISFPIVGSYGVPITSVTDKSVNGIYISYLTEPVYYYLFLMKNRNSGKYSPWRIALSDGKFSCVSNVPIIYAKEMYGRYGSLGSISSESYDKYVLDARYYDIGKIDCSIDEYFGSPDFVLGEFLDKTVVVNPERVWIDAFDDAALHAPAITAPISIPADVAKMEENLKSVSLAADKDALYKALGAAGIAIDIGVDVPGESESESEGTGDVTDDKDTAIGKALQNILDGITGLGNKVEAVPREIANFFTLDTSVISDEFEGLQDAFTAKFAGISLLADVFTKSYSFDMTVPVFTVPVPETLREMFSGQSEIVIMDLRPHTELFLQLRSLLVAMFWVAFAKWLLDQFDVKFHVG